MHIAGKHKENARGANLEKIYFNGKFAQTVLPVWEDYGLI